MEDEAHQGEDEQQLASPSGPSDMDMMARSDPADAATPSHQGNAANPGNQEEDAVYVVLDMDQFGEQIKETHKQYKIAPGDTIELSGLDTFTPQVRMPDGRICKAQYEETVGTCLLLQVRHPEDLGEQPVLQYFGQTERILKVKQPP